MREVKSESERKMRHLIDPDRSSQQATTIKGSLSTTTKVTWILILMARVLRQSIVNNQLPQVLEIELVHFNYTFGIAILS